MDESGIFNQSYWLSLRERTDIKGKGNRLCDLWCNQTYNIIKQENPNINLEKRVTPRGLSHKLTQVNLVFHAWLELKKDNKRFIADGTAGQIDPAYPEGFYGFFDNASIKLKKVYLNMLNKEISDILHPLNVINPKEYVQSYI